MMRNMPLVDSAKVMHRRRVVVRLDAIVRHLCSFMVTKRVIQVFVERECSKIGSIVVQLKIELMEILLPRIDVASPVITI